MTAPTIGSVVHYLLTPHEVRPAIITAVFKSDGYPGGYGCNMTVFLDIANDFVEWRRKEHPSSLLVEGRDAFACSATQGDEPGCWRWPPRS